MLFTMKPFSLISVVFLLLKFIRVHADFPRWEPSRLFNEIPQDRGTIAERLHQFPPRNSSIGNLNLWPSLDSSETPTAGCPYTSKDAYDLVDAIDKLVDIFYAKNAKHFPRDSDAGFGLLTLTNQMEYMLDAQKQKLFPELENFFHRMRDSSRSLALKLIDKSIKVDTIPGVKKLFAAIKKSPDILSGPTTWYGSDGIKKHFHEFPKVGNEKEVFYEFLDILCLAELSHDCSAPEVCNALYQGKIYSQFMLVHQIMFQQIANQRSCASANPEIFNNSQEYQDRLCSKAYLEAEFVESHKFPTRFINLFSEHVAYCGLLGYPNFMRGDWLQEILSWRSGSASGCFPNVYGKYKGVDSIIQISVEQKDAATTEDECLVGLTSVGFMTLAINLRYMVDVCEPTIFERYFKDRV